MPRIKPKSAPQPIARNGPATNVLTLSEAAAYLRLPEPDVLGLIQEQGLPARQVRMEWRLLKTAIQEWLSTGTPSLQARKEGQLALAGKYRDDPDLIQICEEAYRQRGHATLEDE
jgi:excisionase family DNA binding protein